MDFSKVGQGHRIAAGAGVLLLIDLWLSWYSVNLPDGLLQQAKAAGVEVGDTSANAWQAFGGTDLLLFLTVIIAIAAAVQAAGVLRIPLRLSSVLLPLAGLMTLWLIYRMLQQPGPNDQVNNEFGMYLGLILTAAVAYGAMRAQGEHEEVSAPGSYSVGSHSATVTSPAPAATTPPPPPAATTPPPAAPTPPPAATPPPPAAPPAADEPPASPPPSSTL